MKRLMIFFIAIVLCASCAVAAGSYNAAFQQAAKEAGATTATLVKSIDLSEFEDHFGLSLSEDEESLVRIALMAYSNGAILEHPIGVGDRRLASIEEDPYVGNKNSRKFHYSWCSSVSDMKEKNKITFHSREEAVNQGYQPCKKCNP